MKGDIITLSVGKPKIFDWNGKQVSSSIGKTIVDQCFLTFDSFTGDGVANEDFHGGKERAVCFYPYEHYADWEKQFNVKLDPPVFGENICGTGWLEKDTYIGDVFSIGDAIVQVTQGRIPCNTISKYNSVPTFLSRIVETCYTGYFMKVLKEGEIESSSQIVLLERKQEDISVWDATKVMLLDRKNKAEVERMLKLEDLAEDWTSRFQKALQK
ncbi:MOSC domain-containing protein [Niallia taxi]|uniref:MOSC domain-containing protein n=1 Tax=Niallia taxi TaxID=2499688 RepID=UPI0011AA7DA2|nr:MOSC domain-containing protein [Niallia taxi]MED3963364.1 MOSC domain-containing protein [Niallia taxi]WOD61303.1 MOSC domain-containing protein [Niallia taxi]